MRDFKLVLKKELTDILRDKRSFIMLFVPVLLFPMMYILMGTQLNKDYTKNLPCIVDVEPGTADETLYRTLFEQTGVVDRKEVKESETEDLKNGDVYAVIRIKDGGITLLYNDASTKSAAVKDAMEKALNEIIRKSFEQNLQTRYNVSAASLQPFRLETVKLSDETQISGSSTMASIAPMMLVVIIMSSGVSVAIDVFTGEKERGTLEALMTTQVSRMSLLMAKFTATLCISLLGMILSILAYVISYMCSDAAKYMLGGADSGAKLGLSFAQTLELVAVCLTLSIFAVSLMTLIGLHAKSVKEAQSQMSLITLIPTLLAGLTLFMESADISLAAMWIPVFNSIVSIKMIFSGTASGTAICCTALSCLVYSGLMWIVSVKMLRSEKLLQG